VTSGNQPLSSVLARNIDALVAERRAADRNKSAPDRVSDAITAFTGSIRFVAIHAIVFGTWIVWNLWLIPGLTPFDSSFVVLAMVASVEAIFLSTFVLISQNRSQAQQAKRAELDLQISLLAEHEVTQLVLLLDAVARKLGVDPDRVADVEDSKHDVEPRTVLKAIDASDERSIARA